MNNKGQSLVTFVLILPILFLILFMVYEIGRMSLIKNQLDGINYIAMDYGIDKIEDSDIKEQLEELIKKNKDDIDNIIIDINDNKLYITLSSRYSNNITLFKKNNLLRVRSSYVGYLDGDKKIIKENK